MLLLLLCIGFFIGFMVITKIDYEYLLEHISSIGTYLSTNKINFITNHIILLLIMFISAVTIIGLILLPLNIVYEGICIVFNITSFTKVFKVNGFFYGIIYNIITKALYLILLIIIFKKIFTIIKILVTNKEKNKKKIIIIKNAKQLGIYTGILILNDFLVYLVGNKILSLLLFIIK